MLKSLEISGFKSFGKKTLISIDSPITAVVGPNGSGKSNVVEAVRFVLGEQSMKSLRGKGSTDLLFKGSKFAPAANKLKVSITFDNKSRYLSLGSDMGKTISLDFDTVTISRELYADGKSAYSIQGSEVRLKDVTDLLSSVHIGASGHHIISQGEADRLLSASSKDRRSMIDDALGLRIYEIRIRDAERKLEKSKSNIGEIEAARRELAPHLRFLEKQVQKLSEAEEAKRELSRRYFHYEKSAFSILHSKEEEIRREIFKIESDLKQYPEVEENAVFGTTNEIEVLRESLAKIGVEKGTLLRVRENLERNLGRTEGLIEALNAPKKKSTGGEETIHLSTSEFSNFCESLASDIDSLAKEDQVDIYKWTKSLKEISSRVKEFLSKYISSSALNVESPDTNEELQKALAIESDLRSEIKQNIEALSVIEKDEEIMRKDLFAKESEIRLKEADSYKSKVERVRLLGEKARIENELEHILSDILLLNEEKKIFEPFLIFSLDGAETSAPLGKDMLLAERRSLERLRMKLEEIGGGSGGDIISEYEETKSRDEYLHGQLNDLNKSISSLLDLISELRETVRKEFTKGIEKINTEFKEFFRAMFGGGSAMLSLVAELKRPSSTDEELDMDGIEGDDVESEVSSLPKFERGVDIHVDLPNKKVKELGMLSGGERSLVSIALLFAMSQVNPPPFLVLDETDAALDEANSRRYGDMLEKLSATTQLLVVTHNRETMSRAGTIYGVTMGSDAVSKLLSIEFHDAVKVAK